MKRFAHPAWLLLLAAIGYGVYVSVQLRSAFLKGKVDDDRIRHIVASEELMLDLNSQLRKLSRSIANLELPDKNTLQVFGESILASDLASIEPKTQHDSLSIQARIRKWSIGTEQKTKATDLKLWQPLIKNIAYVDHAKFYFIDGKFAESSLSTFSTNVGFKGLAKYSDGTWAGIKAKQRIEWTRSKADTWHLSAWKLSELKTIESPKLLFTEILDEALPDPVERKRARTSEHEIAVETFYSSGGNDRPWKYFTPISANQRPGISVVDIDQDGFDDLYIMVRRGRNQLLRNRGDGTFEEVASKWGLDVENYNSCGIFADFDNDGDPDLMLGRSFERSIYLENTASGFIEKRVSDDTTTLPFLVVSMSAADFNRDGLLDVYLSTYRPAVLESLVSDESTVDDAELQQSGQQEKEGIDAIANDSKRWPEEFLTADQANEYERRLAANNDSSDQFGRILDQIGPPNVLLVNQGHGEFAVAAESPQLALWRNSLQATWADMDDDGDPDLYVANDWSRDNLFINNGKSGFADVTDELGATEFGFGMGVSWGDYDRDGYQDIYVSNMYSKAGRRITSQIAELDPSYNRSVDGNFLYKNSDQGFKLVSGLEPPGLAVAEAGWSWGGQFADVDNDGFLDIYVLSGYFTAPEAYASEVDL